VLVPSIEDVPHYVEHQVDNNSEVLVVPILQHHLVQRLQAEELLLDLYKPPNVVFEGV